MAAEEAAVDMIDSTAEGEVVDTTDRTVEEAGTREEVEDRASDTLVMVHKHKRRVRLSLEGEEMRKRTTIKVMQPEAVDMTNRVVTVKVDIKEVGDTNREGTSKAINKVDISKGVGDTSKEDTKVAGISRVGDINKEADKVQDIMEVDKVVVAGEEDEAEGEAGVEEEGVGVVISDTF